MAPHYGCILRAPSKRITSPFSTGFRIIASTSKANSSGFPSRAGFGMVFAKNDLTFSGKLANKGVSNSPGINSQLLLQ